jgi:GNAT superfamily N-acetyltransferase
MLITVYPNAETFLECTQVWLEALEVENSLVTGLALKEASQPLESPSLFVSIADASGLTIAGLMNPGRNLLLSGDPAEPIAGIEELAAEIYQRSLRVPGVIASQRVAGGFVQVWWKRTGQAGWLKIRERLYKLVEVSPLPWPGGVMRYAQEDDLEILSAWGCAFDEEALGSGDAAMAQERAERRVAEQSLFVWDDHGLAAMAGKSRPTCLGCAVGLVYTPPERRKRGYASALVAALSQALLDEGFQYCSLFTDLANPTSNHIYQTIGYRAVADFDEYAIG